MPGKFHGQKSLVHGVTRIRHDFVVKPPPEEWDGEGRGREVQEGEDICVPMAIHVEV